MKNFNAPNFENLHEKMSVSEAYENIKPEITIKFRPSNAESAKIEFLENENLTKPNNHYGEYNAESIFELGKNVENAILALETDEDLSENERKIYENQIEVQAKRYKFLRAGLDFGEAKNDEEKAAAREEFMKYNREIWGSPDLGTFESILGDKLNGISARDFDARGEQIRAELFSSLADFDFSNNSRARFKPSKEVFERFGDGVRVLFSEQLAQIPDSPKNGDKFSAKEIAEVFERVLASFEDGTDFSKFEVAWKDSGAINVNSIRRKIEIPKNRASISKEKLEGLVAHELGTHYYRSQIGESFGVAPLRKGLDGYLDTEEGIARAMEMSLAGEYQEAGVAHYITAGLAEFGGRNFREVFEVNWRLYALEDSKSGEISDEDIEKARERAYRNTQRIFRGTDELPWFKDLSYFNGGQKIWRYIEENINNPELFDNLLLGGKANIFDASHEQILYNLKTDGR